MHWARFPVFNMIGAALWVGVWTSVGYFSGNHITSIYNTITQYLVYFGLAFGVLLIGYIAWRVRRSRRSTPSPRSRPDLTGAPSLVEPLRMLPLAHHLLKVTTRARVPQNCSEIARIPAHQRQIAQSRGRLSL